MSPESERLHQEEAVAEVNEGQLNLLPVSE